MWKLPDLATRSLCHYLKICLLSCLLIIEHSVVGFVYWLCVTSIISNLIWCIHTGEPVLKFWERFWAKKAAAYSKTLKIWGTGTWTQRVTEVVCEHSSQGFRSTEVQEVRIPSWLQTIHVAVSHNTGIPKCWWLGVFVEICEKVMKLSIWYCGSCMLFLCVQIPGLQRGVG